MFDHYAVARRIAEDVERQGRGEAAVAIRAAIDEGSSGTEIFMRLRSQLQPLTADFRLSRTTRKEVDDLLSKLSDGLSG